MRRTDHPFKIVLMPGRGRAATARVLALLDEILEVTEGKNLSDYLRLAQVS
jgi:hypothetical protein